MNKTPLILFACLSLLWVIACLQAPLIGATWPLILLGAALAIFEAKKLRGKWTLFSREFIVKAVYEHPFDGWDQKFCICVKAHSMEQATRRFWEQEKAEGNDVRSTKIREIRVKRSISIGESNHRAWTA